MHYYLIGYIKQSKNSYLAEDLTDESLPECQDIKEAIPFNDFPRSSSNPEWESMGSRYNGFSISPYILCGLVGLVVLGFLTIVLVK